MPEFCAICERYIEWDGHTESAHLKSENERLRAQALSMTVYAQGQEARIDAALAIIWELRNTPTLGWKSLDRITKALRGGDDDK